MTHEKEMQAKLKENKIKRRKLDKKKRQNMNQH